MKDSGTYRYRERDGWRNKVMREREDEGERGREIWRNKVMKQRSRETEREKE
jgi:hypothetical protein